MQVTVHGDSPHGWDERTPVNEVLDENGAVVTAERGFGVADPRAPRVRRYDDPDVVALRERLRQRNGLYGLEICAPHEVERVARIFHRDGFVVVRDLLDAQQLERTRAGCARVLGQIFEHAGHDGRRYLSETMRLPHRYSYGTSSASRQLLHEPEWAALIDLPTTTPLINAIFGSDDYQLWGAGGDLCLPGAIEYQHLHADFRDDHGVTAARIAQARKLGVDLPDDAVEAADVPFKLLRHVSEVTPPMVTINFLMSDLTWENGPIRQIPGTHAAGQPPPDIADEPDWMLLSTLVGARAGAGVFRDNRAWHGATPNVSREIRAMPNVEYGAPWLPAEAIRPTMPYAVWESLSAHGRRVALRARAEPGVWPAGAGVMHPLASGRRDAARAAKSAARNG